MEKGDCNKVCNDRTKIAYDGKNADVNFFICMKGLAIIIVGYQGAGKSLLAKSIIKPVHSSNLRILDINNEYTEFGGVVSDDEGEPDFETFQESMIKDKKKFWTIY